MRFYTSVWLKYDTLYVRGYDEGRRFQDKIEYAPYLFEQHPDGDYRTIRDEPVRKIKFSSVKRARDYLKLHEGVENKTIYGLTNFTYLYVFDAFPGKIEYDSDLIRVATLDIEVAADRGFPDIKLADKEVTAITIRTGGKSVVLGCGVYREKSDDVTYVFCRDEAELLENFIACWRHMDPDVVTGWNVEFFDVPYIVNRIARVLGGDRVPELSPWGQMEEREVDSRGSKVQTYVPAGVTILDYMKLYKKFTHKNQESYSLNNIASVELDERKLDYSEYTSLQDLYKQDYERFIDYNINDVLLVDKLEEKLGFIELVFSLAYDCKVCYADTLGTVRMWDMLIHDHLMSKGVVVPPIKEDHEYFDLVGGYVKEAKVGRHSWVVSFDLNSSYMHQVMQYNISPDTFVGKLGDRILIDQILDGTAMTPELRKHLVDNNLSMTANGCVFTKDKRGFLPEIAEQIYNDRLVYKRRYLELKDEYKRTKNPKTKKLMEKFKHLQDAKKVQMNSGYGAIANKYFRWYNSQHAEAITSSGQLAIRWIADRMNHFMNGKLGTSGVDYILASDTDSIYVDMRGVTDRLADHDVDLVDAIYQFCQSMVEPMIEQSYEDLASMMNAYQQKMFMKMEKICRTGIWKASKNYVLYVEQSETVRYPEPEVEITGIEAVRSSTPLIIRRWIEEALKIIMSSDNDALIAKVAEWREDHKSRRFDEIAFPRGVKFRYGATAKRQGGTYSLESPGLPIQVRAALLYNRRIAELGLTRCEPIAPIDKIKWVYLKTPNSIGENVIAAPAMLPEELGLEEYIDYKTQFEKSFLEPLRAILEVIGWEAERTSTLEAFF